MKIKWKRLLGSLVIVYFVALIGSFFIGNTNSDWYNTIKPSITPPNWVFPVVWNILFFLIGISFYFVLISKNKKAAAFFIANFALNILWVLFYFQLKNPLLAFYEILVLWISIILLFNITWKINKKAFYFLIPYFVWVSFAVLLNYLSI